MTKEECLWKAFRNTSGAVVVSTELKEAMDQYAQQEVVKELQSLLDNNSTQHYWPAIIKQRVKELSIKK